MKRVGAEYEQDQARGESYAGRYPADQPDVEQTDRSPGGEHREQAVGPVLEPEELQHHPVDRPRYGLEVTAVLG